jgi:hypothetical protein
MLLSYIRILYPWAVLSIALLRIPMILTAAQTGLETHGPLGTLWVSLGLICFYIALIWINTLLGVFLTPLFLIPQTWLMDWLKQRKDARASTNPR